MLTTNQALLIKVLDDAGPMRAKEAHQLCRKYVKSAGRCERYLAEQGLIAWKPGGYYMTDAGAQALLDYERTVKRFLDEVITDEE